MKQVKDLEELKRRYEDIHKLETTFNNIGGDKKILGLALIDELYFMGEALYELKILAKKNKYIEKFEQGSQKFLREHPALKSYNTTIKNYQSTMKQINDLLPFSIIEDEPENPGEKLLKHLASDE